MNCLHCGHSSVEHIPACAHRDVAVRKIRVVESPWRAATRYDRSERPCDCASQLFDYVKQNHRPDLRHSPTLSEDGKAWSRYEQSRTAARRTVAQRQLLHRGIPFPEGWVPAPDQFINSVGQHWTSDLSVAEAFSDPVTYGESFGSPDDNEYYRGTGAVVSAWHDPATAKPITDKEILHKLHGGDYPEDKEVTFSSGAPLEVHSIKYLPVGGQEWKEISGVQGNGITA